MFPTAVAYGIPGLRVAVSSNYMAVLPFVVCAPRV